MDRTDLKTRGMAHRTITSQWLADFQQLLLLRQSFKVASHDASLSQMALTQSVSCRNMYF